jgi:hypothetical protein
MLARFRLSCGDAISSLQTLPKLQDPRKVPWHATPRLNRYWYSDLLADFIVPAKTSECRKPAEGLFVLNDEAIYIQG